MTTQSRPHPQPKTTKEPLKPKPNETPVVEHRPDDEVKAAFERLSRESPGTWEALAK